MRSPTAPSEAVASVGKPRQIAQALANAIVAGHIDSGTYLPPEKDLAARHGASRPVVREALHTVAAAGLVETRHGVGSYVNQPRAWNLFDAVVMQAYLSTGNLPSILNELMELRRLVEVEAAGIAAERIGRAAAAELRDWLEQMENVVGDADGSARADIAFHDTITNATENRFVANIVRYLEHALVEARYITSRAGGLAGRRRALEAHRRIYAAIRERDVQRARHQMSEHVRQSEADLRRALLRPVSEGSMPTGDA